MIETIFRSEDDLYTEVELRREGTTVLVAAYDLFGRVKLYRIEWVETDYYRCNQAEHRLDLAVRCFNAHVPPTPIPTPPGAGITTNFLCGRHTDTNVECRGDTLYWCPKCQGTPPSVTDYDTLYPYPTE